MVDLVTLPGAVIATGGGAILNEESRRLMRASGAVVYLQTSLVELHERTKRDTKRPLLQGANSLATLTALMAVREPLYREAAHIIVESGRTSVAKLADAIVQQLVERGLWKQDA
jgi:shikimate kinase